MENREKLNNEKSLNEIVEEGYKKIAFGDITDAVKLVFAEDYPQNLSKLNLFTISELKRAKGGGLEVKFFDRLKALECLSQLDSGSEKVDLSFYQALEKSSKLIGKSGDSPK